MRGAVVGGGGQHRKKRPTSRENRDMDVVPFGHGNVQGWVKNARCMSYQKQNKT
jgi:hypothetical protein